MYLIKGLSKLNEEMYLIKKLLNSLLKLSELWTFELWDIIAYFYSYFSFWSVDL
jgi:hypothetical protein